MRFLHTSDWHVGKSLRGRSRADEHRAVLAEIGDIVREEKVDVVLVAGDLFDTASPNAESEEIVYRALLDLAASCEWLVVIAGNHDNPKRLSAVEPLMRLTNIRLLPAVARPEDGGVIVLQTKLGGVRIALLPFLSQRHIIRASDLMMREGYEHVGSYAERATAIVRALCAEQAPPATVDILLAHAMVHGGVLGGGERQAHTIFEYSVPATAFPASLHYVALGHLHRAQKIPGACPIWYSGSPLQLDFGETRDRKSVNLIEAEPGTPATVSTIPLTSGRNLVHVRTTLSRLMEIAANPGDDYLRVEIEGPTAPGLADLVREQLPNAVDVVVPPRTEERRAPQTERIGPSPRELFAEYLVHKDADAPELRALFDELLEEVYAPD